MVKTTNEETKDNAIGLEETPIVIVDPKYFRPTEVDTLLGDSTKAKLKLGWTPKISFDQLVTEMVADDLKEAEKEKLLKLGGY